MNKIMVRSRDGIEAVNPDAYGEEHIIISIYCSDDKPARIQESKLTKAILTVMFDDITIKHCEKYPAVAEKYKIFTTHTAKTIADFIEKHILVPLVICQCDAGISRSAGVASALSKFYLGNDDEFFGARSRYVPNTMVYSVLLDEIIMRDRCKRADMIGINFV